MKVLVALPGDVGAGDDAPTEMEVEVARCDQVLVILQAIALKIGTVWQAVLLDFGSEPLAWAQEVQGCGLCEGARLSASVVYASEVRMQSGGQFFSPTHMERSTESSRTVLELGEEMEKRLHCPRTMQRIIFKGAEVNGDATLQEVGLVAGETFHVLHGGERFVSSVTAMIPSVGMKETHLVVCGREMVRRLEERIRAAIPEIDPESPMHIMCAGKTFVDTDVRVEECHRVYERNHLRTTLAVVVRPSPVHTHETK
eukprot:TRINITY_DN22083_c0_g1_i1.p1 TRINITY_DN22083_c0_g1~~TRINITY_DN22083_c0_g1_i1.p1  ORF type:complete len:256 (-),score=69.55 TRINITY_DN22083_c0_g1_i1:247-1014(-)